VEILRCILVLDREEDSNLYPGKGTCIRMKADACVPGAAKVALESAEVHAKACTVGYPNLATAWKLLGDIRLQAHAVTPPDNGEATGEYNDEGRPGGQNSIDASLSGCVLPFTLRS
jgi:hypothetical protein